MAARPPIATLIFTLSPAPRSHTRSPPSALPPIAVFTAVPEGSFASVTFSAAQEKAATAALAKVLRALAPGAAVTFSLGVGADISAAKRALLFGGFSDVQADAAAGTVSAKKSGFATGAGASVVTRSAVTVPAAASAAAAAKPAPAAVAAPAKSAGAWTVSAMDDDLDEADGSGLVDEDALLAKDPIPEGKREYDCGTGDGGARKACRNCTCGLADEEQAAAAAAAGEQPKGGCGSCSLGDAFRCASCPSLGLPAWADGDKVKVKL